MTREEVYERSLEELETKNNILLELSTGFGKSKIAIEIVNKIKESEYKDKEIDLLLLVAKKVHKETWKEEFIKWGLAKYIKVTCECYESLKKHTKEKFQIVIADEIHHLNSDLSKALISTIEFDHILGLSATVPKELRNWLNYKYNIAIIKSSIESSIADKVLPAPKILLVPLVLDNKTKSEYIILNQKAKKEGIIYDDIKNANKYKRKKDRKVYLRATQKEKVEYMDKDIEGLKNWYERSNIRGIKLKWLNECGKRLKYLANLKNPIVLNILESLKDKRTLTFCTDIEQTKVLGTNCIHSKNKESKIILEKFNKGEINHISACQILNEGVNLTECQYGIFANINSSAILQRQRCGRLLRHQKPIIIVPFYKGTREEEIVKKMFEDYDKNLIQVVRSKIQSKIKK